ATALGSGRLGGRHQKLGAAEIHLRDDGAVERQVPGLGERLQQARVRFLDGAQSQGFGKLEGPRHGRTATHALEYFYRFNLPGNWFSRTLIDAVVEFRGSSRRC